MIKGQIGVYVQRMFKAAKREKTGFNSRNKAGIKNQFLQTEINIR